MQCINGPRGASSRQGAEQAAGVGRGRQGKQGEQGRQRNAATADATAAAAAAYLIYATLAKYSMCVSFDTHTHTYLTVCCVYGQQIKDCMCPTMQLRTTSTQRERRQVLASYKSMQMPFTKVLGKVKAARRRRRGVARKE